MVPTKTAKKAKKILEVESKQPRDYELVLIISPEIADEALDSTIDRINQFITDNGGTISEIERWGKRKLAYPIKRFLEATYVLTKLKLDTKSTKDIEAKLQVSEEVLRHLLIKLSS